MSTRTNEQKRAANNLIRHNWGFWLPMALLKKMSLEQVRGIIAILNEADNPTTRRI